MLQKIKLQLLLLLCIIAVTSFAQSPVTIPIETEKNALVLQTDNNSRLIIVYYGKKLSDAAEYATLKKQYNKEDENAGIFNTAYTPSGTFNLVEPALQVIHGDGNTSLELKYVSHQITKVDDNVTLTSILLTDPVYNDEITLWYKTYNKENVMEQWTVIKNTEKKPLRMQKYASANLFFMGHDYYLMHYNGIWAKEMRPEEDHLTHGIKSIDSKLGTRANLFEPPTFMVSIDKPATEDDGNVVFGQLAWSGNFKIDFEVDALQNLRLIAGINPYAAEYTLAPGQEFTTPALFQPFPPMVKAKLVATCTIGQPNTGCRMVEDQGSRCSITGRLLILILMRKNW